MCAVSDGTHGEKQSIYKRGYLSHTKKRFEQGVSELKVLCIMHTKVRKAKRPGGGGVLKTYILVVVSSVIL